MNPLLGLGAVGLAAVFGQIVSREKSDEYWATRWKGRMTGDQTGSDIRWTMMMGSHARRLQACGDKGGDSISYFDKDGYEIGWGCLFDSVKFPKNSNAADASVIGLKIINSNFSEWMVGRSHRRSGSTRNRKRRQ